MGVFDLAGTTFSGWLTDRFNSRYLLFWYYVLRGLSLLFLPYSLSHPASWLSLFAVFLRLDWVATVPPTVRLTANTFGKENVGVVYGWIGASHQLGASLAALTAGSIRTYLGDYRDAFWLFRWTLPDCRDVAPLHPQHCRHGHDLATSAAQPA